MKTAIKIIAITAIAVLSAGALTTEASAQGSVVNSAANFLHAFLAPQQSGQPLQVQATQPLHQQAFPVNQQFVQPVVHQRAVVHQQAVVNQQPVVTQAVINFLTDISGTYSNGSRTGTIRKVGNSFEWSDTTGTRGMLTLDTRNLQLVTTYTDRFGVAQRDQFQFTISQNGNIRGFTNSGMFFTRTR